MLNDDLLFDENNYDLKPTQSHQKEQSIHTFITIIDHTYHQLFSNSSLIHTLMLDHYDTHDKLLSLANFYYGTNDIERCLIVLFRITKMYPTKFEFVYILYLLLEDNGDKENAYVCYCKHIEKGRNENEIYHAYLLSKELCYDLDTIFYLCKLQTFANKREYVAEKIELYDRIHKTNVNPKFFYCKKISAMFEIMAFDGYIYNLKDYIDNLNQYTIKKILNQLNEHFTVRMPEFPYLYAFIDYCFEYKEYKMYLQYKKIDDRIQNLDDQLRSIIATEECEEFDEGNTSKIDNFGNLRTDFSDPYTQYLEYCINNHDLIFKTVTNKHEYYNEDLYSQISDLHFCLLDLLFYKNKIEPVRHIINKMISKYDICFSSLDDFTEKDVDKLIINALDVYKNKTILYMGIYYQRMSKTDLAICLLTKLYTTDYSNEETKQLLNELHSSRGDTTTARLYEKMLDKEKKTKITSRKVLKIRKRLEKLIELLNNIQTNEDMNEFIAQAKKLVKRFFTNSFIFREDKRPRVKKFTKYTRLKHYMKKLKYTSYRNKSKSERRKIFCEFRNFHGLLFCEWHYIIKNLILAYFDQGNYKKANSLIIRFVQGHYHSKYMKPQIDYFYNIAFIGIKAALVHNDFDSIVHICKKLSPDYYFLVYYFTNKFEDYGSLKSFRIVQRNLKRILMRNGNIERYDTKKMTQIGNGTLTDITSDIYKGLDAQTRVRMLSAYYPRYIHKISAKMLLDAIDSNMGFEEALILSTIMLNHSLSKKLGNGEVYVDAGFRILFEAEKRYMNEEEKIGVIWYNIARAYQLMGVLGWAEVYYKKCMKFKGELREFAFHNLSKIYSIRDAKELYFNVLEQINKDV